MSHLVLYAQGVCMYAHLLPRLCISPEFQKEKMCANPFGTQKLGTCPALHSQCMISYWLFCVSTVVSQWPSWETSPRWSTGDYLSRQICQVHLPKWRRDEHIRWWGCWETWHRWQQNYRVPQWTKRDTHQRPQGLLLPCPSLTFMRDNPSWICSLKVLGSHRKLCWELFLNTSPASINSNI